MTKNVKLIYDLIQKDLKAQGWDDESIAEAIAESQRERQAIGADDYTICVKELSYLSKESLQIIASKMDKNKMNNNFLSRLKNWIVKISKDYWYLNWEAKIGILFLIPPILGIFIFILNFFDADIGFESFPDSWYSPGTTPAIPIYLGLMAIAGSYLIKGNLKKNTNGNR